MVMLQESRQFRLVLELKQLQAVHWLPAEHLVRAVMVLLHWVKVLLQIQQLVFQLVRMREWVHHKVQRMTVQTTLLLDVIAVKMLLAIEILL